MNLNELAGLLDGLAHECMDEFDAYHEANADHPIYQKIVDILARISREAEEAHPGQRQFEMEPKEKEKKK